MRITQSIITRTILEGINNSRQNMNKAQLDIASGKSLHKASDNPLGFTRMSRYQSMMSQNDNFINNINNSKGWLTTTGAALNHLLDRVMEARGFAIQGADDSLNATNRAALADMVDGLLEESISLVNTKYMGKNLFAGTKTKKDTSFDYDSDTNSIVYNGNTGNINRKIGTSLSVTINVNGNQLMNTGIFTSLIDLRDALESNDRSSIQSMIGTLQNVGDQMASLASGVGSIQNHMRLASQRLETANINLSSYLSQIEDTDMAEAITRYNTEEMTYNAALKTASDVIRTNLMDFLR